MCSICYWQWLLKLPPPPPPQRATEPPPTAHTTAPTPPTATCSHGNFVTKFLLIVPSGRGNLRSRKFGCNLICARKTCTCMRLGNQDLWKESKNNYTEPKNCIANFYLTMNTKTNKNKNNVLVYLFRFVLQKALIFYRNWQFKKKSPRGRRLRPLKIPKKSMTVASSFKLF